MAAAQIVHRDGTACAHCGQPGRDGEVVVCPAGLPVAGVRVAGGRVAELPEAIAALAAFGEVLGRAVQPLVEAWGQMAARIGRALAGAAVQDGSPSAGRGQVGDPCGSPQLAELTGAATEAGAAGPAGTGALTAPGTWQMPAAFVQDRRAEHLAQDCTGRECAVCAREGW